MVPGKLLLPSNCVSCGTNGWLGVCISIQTTSRSMNWEAGTIKHPFCGPRFWRPNGGKLAYGKGATSPLKRSSPHKRSLISYAGPIAEVFSFASFLSAPSLPPSMPNAWPRVTSKAVTPFLSRKLSHATPVRWPMPSVPPRSSTALISMTIPKMSFPAWSRTGHRFSVPQKGASSPNTLGPPNRGRPIFTTPYSQTANPSRPTFEAALEAFSICWGILPSPRPNGMTVCA